jgi:hypothetical protein
MNQRELKRQLEEADREIFRLKILAVCLDAGIPLLPPELTDLIIGTPKARPTLQRKTPKNGHQ